MTQNNWEERFDEFLRKEAPIVAGYVDMKKVKPFISSEISKAREEEQVDKVKCMFEARRDEKERILNLIERMYRLDAYNTTPTNIEANGWNQALSSLKDKLTEGRIKSNGTMEQPDGMVMM